jgi:hypothetical protein
MNAYYHGSSALLRLPRNRDAVSLCCVMATPNIIGKYKRSDDFVTKRLASRSESHGLGSMPRQASTS